jgi:hypothetical protein
VAKNHDWNWNHVGTFLPFIMLLLCDFLKDSVNEEQLVASHTPTRLL